MAVKPPMGTGRVRLVVIGEDGSVDLQPCGGTHVQAHRRDRPVVVTKIEKKGKLNRRIRVVVRLSRERARRPTATSNRREQERMARRR